MAFRKLNDDFVPGQKEQLARDTFYGKHERLDDYIMDMKGYEENGQWYRATGLSLSEMIDVVSSIPDDLVARLIEGDE